MTQIFYHPLPIAICKIPSTCCTTFFNRVALTFLCKVVQAKNKTPHMLFYYHLVENMCNRNHQKTSCLYFLNMNVILKKQPFTYRQPPHKCSYLKKFKFWDKLPMTSARDPNKHHKKSYLHLLCFTNLHCYKNFEYLIWACFSIS